MGNAICSAFRKVSDVISSFLSVFVVQQKPLEGRLRSVLLRPADYSQTSGKSHSFLELFCHLNRLWGLNILVALFTSPCYNHVVGIGFGHCGLGRFLF